MVVSINFMGTQQMVTNTSNMDMPISKQTTAKDALDFVKQHYPALSLDTGTIFIAVNQEIVPLDKVLKANDTISFIPVMGGG
jgi:sulfur carrier protein ThiS